MATLSAGALLTSQIAHAAQSGKILRTGYGVQSITPETLAYQQQIADTFIDLKLISKKLAVIDARWSVA